MNTDLAGEMGMADAPPADAAVTEPEAVTFSEGALDLRLRLELDQPAPYDPLALVSVLPAGGTNLRPAPDGQPPGILQSDIFICLW